MLSCRYGSLSTRSCSYMSQPHSVASRNIKQIISHLGTCTLWACKMQYTLVFKMFQCWLHTYWKPIQVVIGMTTSRIIVSNLLLDIKLRKNNWSSNEQLIEYETNNCNFLLGASCLLSCCPTKSKSLDDFHYFHNHFPSAKTRDDLQISRKRK